MLECPEQHYSDVRLLKTLAAAAVSIRCAVIARADFSAQQIGSSMRACLLGVLVILPLANLNIAAKRVWCAVRVPVAQRPRQSKEFPRGPLPPVPAATPEAKSRTNPQAPAEAAGQATAVEDRRAERLKPRARRSTLTRR